jgi:hypothetical protein
MPEKNYPIYYPIEHRNPICVTLTVTYTELTGYLKSVVPKGTCLFESDRGHQGDCVQQGTAGTCSNVAEQSSLSLGLCNRSHCTCADGGRSTSSQATRYNASRLRNADMGGLMQSLAWFHVDLYYLALTSPAIRALPAVVIRRHPSRL